MARPQGALFGLNLLEKNGLGKKWEEARDYFNWRRKYAKQLLQFKDKHLGEDCFIIGNGPSLKHMDLSPLRDYHTFGQNKIFLIFEKALFVHWHFRLVKTRICAVIPVHAVEPVPPVLPCCALLSRL